MMLKWLMLGLVMLAMKVTFWVAGDRILPFGRPRNGSGK